ncbi:hypothetical protein ACFPN0_07090 [Kitasatospora cinereorecta]
MRRVRDRGVVPSGRVRTTAARTALSRMRRTSGGPRLGERAHTAPHEEAI